MCHLLLARSQDRCELCAGRLPVIGAAWAQEHAVHYRRPRSFSDRTADPHCAANLLLVCGTADEGCRGWLSSHRADAFEMGYLVHKHEDPAQVRVELHHGYVWLNADGTYDSARRDMTTPRSSLERG